LVPDTPTFTIPTLIFLGRLPAAAENIKFGQDLKALVDSSVALLDASVPLHVRLTEAQEDVEVWV
jgi:hypothetical protein